jgi:hypothetical protein
VSVEPEKEGGERGGEAEKKRGKGGKGEEVIVNPYFGVLASGKDGHFSHEKLPFS